MSITIGDKPEQNVVNVGDEISTDQLAAIQNGLSTPSSTNPFVTSGWADSRFQLISGMSGYLTRTNTFNTADAAVKIIQTGTGDAFVVEDETSDTTPFRIDQNGAVGIATSGTLQSGARLHLTGNMQVTSGTITITNVGTAGCMVLNQSNSTSTNIGLQVLYNGTSDAVRITNTGSGNSILVEDSTNPDSTSFKVDNSGNVTLGGSLTMNSGSLFTSVGSQTYPHELEFKVGSTTYRVPARAI